MDNDYELLSYIYSESEEAHEILLNKYKPLIINISQKMLSFCKNSGVELNDLIQEGLIGLNDAINTYNDSKDVPFGVYAKMCVERKIKDFIKTINRQKNKILNESISFENDDEDIKLDKFLIDKSNNPLELVLNDEWEKQIINKISKDLTDFEKDVFKLKKEGLDYKEIALKLNVDSKKIDNALQRIKQKVKKIIEKEG